MLTLGIDLRVVVDCELPLVVDSCDPFVEHLLHDIFISMNLVECLVGHTQLILHGLKLSKLHLNLILSNQLELLITF